MNKIGTTAIKVGKNNMLLIVNFVVIVLTKTIERTIHTKYAKHNNIVISLLVKIESTIKPINSNKINK
jgi:hypothetical protein